MKQANTKSEQRRVRHNRIRAKVLGTKSIPRLSIFRSNAHIYAQLIDDENGSTIASANDASIKSGNNMEKAKAVGSEIAKKAEGLKVSSVVFDRGGFLYAGRVKALADSAREAGLKF